MHIATVYFRGLEEPRHFSFKDDQIVKDFKRFLAGENAAIVSYEMIAIGSVVIDLRDVTAIQSTLNN